MSFNTNQPFVVVGAVIEQDGKFLLVKETKKVSEGQWNLPAGRLELGENPIDAISREVKEETGFEFKPTHFIGIYSVFRKDLEKKFNIKPQIIEFIFCGKISGFRQKGLAEDISENKWFLPEEIYDMDNEIIRDVQIKDVIKDYLEDKRYPLEIIYHSVTE